MLSRRSRAVVDSLVADGEVVYGVTTGFGDLADVRIEPEQTAELQRNLVRSHAAGVGDPLLENSEVCRGREREVGGHPGEDDVRLVRGRAGQRAVDLSFCAGWRSLKDRAVGESGKAQLRTRAERDL